MRNFKVFAVILVSLLISGAYGNVFAFGLPSLSSAGNPGLSSTVAIQNKLVADFVVGQKAILDSQAKMATALGDKDLAAKLTADGDVMTQGATQDNLGRIKNDSENAASQLSNEMAKAKELSTDGKSMMEKAIPGYIVGVAALIKMKPDYKSFLDAAQKQISSAGMMDVMTVRSKLAIGTYVAANGLGYAESLASSTGNFIAYAKSNNISIPADATAALGSLN